MSNTPGESVTPLESDNPYISYTSVMASPGTDTMYWSQPTTPVGMGMGMEDSTSTPAVPSVDVIPTEETIKSFLGDSATELDLSRTATGASLRMPQPFYGAGILKSRRPARFTPKLKTNDDGSVAMTADVEEYATSSNDKKYGRFTRPVYSTLVADDLVYTANSEVANTETKRSARTGCASKNITGSHLAQDLDPVELRKRIGLAERAIEGYDFDAIAFRGVSGTILAAPLSLAMNKEMVLVRKDDDDTHSSYKVEGFKDVKRYIIIDDFSCSGNTAREILRRIKAWAPDAECLGLLETRYLSESRLQMCGGRLSLTEVKLNED